MEHIRSQDLSERENYFMLTSTIIPRPIAFVTSKSKENVLNGAPFSYFSIVSANPPLVSISVQRSGGEMKDTARNIKELGEFVVHITDEENVEKINLTSEAFEYQISEIEKVGFTPVKSKEISVPGIKEAKVRMECIVEEVISICDNFQVPKADLLIGRVLIYHVDPGIRKAGRVDPKELKAVSRLAGTNYGKIGEIFPLARP